MICVDISHSLQGQDQIYGTDKSREDEYWHDNYQNCSVERFGLLKVLLAIDANSNTILTTDLCACGSVYLTHTQAATSLFTEVSGLANRDGVIHAS